MVIGKTLFVTRREEWREWLESYHSTEKEIWLIFYKKGSGKPRLSYDHAVEEALCFGWIDSLAKKIDEEKYAQKFSPRLPTSLWSETNKERVARLIQSGRMTQVGLAKVTYPHPERFKGKAQVRREEEAIPPDIIRGLKANKRAWTNLNALAPSQRRLYVRWIASAKRSETRERRIREAIDRLQLKKELGSK